MDSKELKLEAVKEQMTQVKQDRDRQLETLQNEIEI